MISQQNALRAMLVLLLLVTLFHILVIFQIIPYGFVWAGKLNTQQEMLVFESTSIIVNIFLIIVLMIKGNTIKSNIPIKIINGIIWFFVVVFALNTIGNLFSKSFMELIFGTSLTLISAILCWRIMSVKKPNH